MRREWFCESIRLREEPERLRVAVSCDRDGDRDGGILTLPGGPRQDCREENPGSGFPAGLTGFEGARLTQLYPTEQSVGKLLLCGVKWHLSGSVQCPKRHAEADYWHRSVHLF